MPPASVEKKKPGGGKGKATVSHANQLQKCVQAFTLRESSLACHGVVFIISMFPLCLSLFLLLVSLTACIYYP